MRIVGAGYQYVLVTGPQRAGTRFVAKALAHDLGRRYADEAEVGTDSLYALDLILDESEALVVQCPALCHAVHYFGDREDTLIVMVKRSVADIEASQRRINWPYEALERAKYQDPPAVPIAEVKYRRWDVQKQSISHWIEVLYESFAGHPLWVPKERRTGFLFNQTEEADG